MVEKSRRTEVKGKGLYNDGGREGWRGGLEYWWWW